MADKTLQVRISSVSPLLMHNGQLANPLNVFAKQLKAVTSKKKKTEDDFAEASRIEWRGGLYVNSKGRLIFPASMLESCIVEGAKKNKLGKAFKSAVYVTDDAEVLIPTAYKSVEELWDPNGPFVDIQGVRVGTSRIMRTRPIFRTWESVFEVCFEADQVNQTEVERAIIDAGAKVGIGDFRPKYGRFTVEFE